MSKAKKLIREYLNNLPAGRRPPVARRTEFTRQADGAVVRRVVRADGIVERRSRTSVR